LRRTKFLCLTSGLFVANRRVIDLIPCRGAEVMTTLQAVCFGAMLAWTPAVIVMALALYETPLDELDELQRDPS
jgi:hypothetical protein